jgi:CRP/FNR family transcriptional regulator, cyclic AMP receptor protein
MAYVNPPRNHDRVTWPATSLIGSLTLSDRAALLAAGTRVEFCDNDILVMQGDIGDVLYVLTGGMVKITVSTEAGSETMLAVRSRGDLIGEFSVMDGVPRCGAFIESHPGAMPVLARSVVAKVRSETERHAAERNWGARERLAQVIYDLAVGYGENVADGGVVIPLPLTQMELGALAGVAVSTTERVLAEFRREGIVQTGYREIAVRDMACLGDTRFA